MFNVGDEVTVTKDHPITKVGDIGTIISIANKYEIRVKFHTMANERFVGYEFPFADYQIELWGGEILTLIERKIKRMYERQSYFLRHRSGQPS